jgi:hypothetical protein
MGASPSRQQLKALRAIGKSGARVSIRSGHGTGKSATLAWLVLWFLSVYHPCKIPCTAPSAHQLFDVLWAEIYLWHSRMPGYLRRRIRVLKDLVAVVGQEKLAFAAARTSRRETPEALQGFHSENLLYVIDEASGIPDRIFEPMEGALTTGNCRVIMTSNPTRQDGYFHRSHHKDRKFWAALRWPSTESPIADPEYARRMAAKWGTESDIYRVRVLGEFPRHGPDTLIPLEWIERALADRDIAAEGMRIAGLDVARFGRDSTSLVVRQGLVLTHAERWQKYDTVFTAGRVKEAWDKGLFDVVAVDEIGIGAGVADQLRSAGVKVNAVSVSEKATNVLYDTLRDQVWFACREWLQGGAAIRCAPELAEDLSGQLASMRMDYSAQLKLRVQSKDAYRKERIEAGLEDVSPDLADAVCLTFSPIGDTYDLSDLLAQCVTRQKTTAGRRE